MLTPEAKARLSATIRELRERLLRDIGDAVVAEYRLQLTVAQSRLGEAALAKRLRLEAWLEERVRAEKGNDPKKREALRKRHLDSAVKEAAATHLNRLVLLRHLEALHLSRPEVVTGGWNSKGYRQFREFAPALTDLTDPNAVSGDQTEGYAFLLKLLFDELALDLPGLFGDVGMTSLIPVPASTLRHLVERLDDPELEGAWTDDTTLGWVYQYWNDPEREALDAKVHSGGKVEPYEIASKTQMFTERYMVEWLLQNSLGVVWLGICARNGWRPEASEIFPELERRRAEWREARSRGEIPADEPMAIREGLEERWKYYVPQELPSDAPGGPSSPAIAGPTSIRDVKILDVACGSGHFLVSAFDLLAALYNEEARHRGVEWSEKEVAESILERNLHGVDIDPRAVQIAAAALFLKARNLAKEGRPRFVNLVAPALNLGRLAPDDPALVRLREELRREAGVPPALTDAILKALAEVDHVGTLLKVGKAVEDAIRAFEEKGLGQPVQPSLYDETPAAVQAKFDFQAARASILEKMEAFLGKHLGDYGEEDLGLRLDGEQLAAGLRFLRIVREESYDIVVGNPPYQGTARMADASYVAKTYPRGKADLYAAFLERALELARPGGLSALLTMRGWMFIAQFTALREHLLKTYDFRLLGDVDRGAFDEVPNEVLAAVMTVFRRAQPSGQWSVALQPTPLSDRSYDRERTSRKRAAVLGQVGRYEFEVRGLKDVPGEPVLYWWDRGDVSWYANATKLSEVAPVRQGLSTTNDHRFIRKWWEPSSAHRCFLSKAGPSDNPDWVPIVMGAAGRKWCEPSSDVARWKSAALDIRSIEGSAVRSPEFYFRPIAIAFSMIGTVFSARAHRFPSAFANKGSSVFPESIADVLCCMNSERAQFVLQSLNPGIGFEVGDVVRLPIFPVDSSTEIYATLDRAFTEHEAARETSVEFTRPGHSAWIYAQGWAQRSVDRLAGSPLPLYDPIWVLAAPEHHVSFAFGVAMGRFGGDGEGILDEAPASALPAGILFVSDATEEDSLSHPACAPLHAAWAEHGSVVGEGADLRTWLRKSYFALHREVYENRPIYFPLSSAKKIFVAWVSIHRWTADTLKRLLADHLQGERRRLDGEMEDLRAARHATDAKERNRAEKRYADLQKKLEELVAFMETVATIAEKGAPPVDSKCPPREADAPFVMDLDDGVMVNSAALWPLLASQWAKPADWWKELARGEGRKDYDWAHLSARYFPRRVDTKCQTDPSLAVAHGCFWRYHPSRAYSWELRLQDEIRTGFTIDEAESDEARRRFLLDHPGEAKKIRRKEMRRRKLKALRARLAESGDLFRGEVLSTDVELDAEAFDDEADDDLDEGVTGNEDKADA